MFKAEGVWEQKGLVEMLVDKQTAIKKWRGMEGMQLIKSMEDMRDDGKGWVEKGMRKMGDSRNMVRPKAALRNHDNQKP